MEAVSQYDLRPGLRVRVRRKSGRPFAGTILEVCASERTPGSLYLLVRDEKGRGLYMVFPEDCSLIERKGGERIAVTLELATEPGGARPDCPSDGPVLVAPPR